MFVDDEIQSAGAAGRVADVNGDIEQAERLLYLAMIKRHIEANIGTDSLAADDLCRRFRIFLPACIYCSVLMADLRATCGSKGSMFLEKLTQDVIHRHSAVAQMTRYGHRVWSAIVFRMPSARPERVCTHC
jgi:hypothetical protein